MTQHNPDHLDRLADRLTTTVLTALEREGDLRDNLRECLWALVLTGGKSDGETVLQRVDRWLASVERAEIRLGVDCLGWLGSAVEVASRVAWICDLAMEGEKKAIFALGQMFPRVSPEESKFILDTLMLQILEQLQETKGAAAASKAMRTVFPSASLVHQQAVLDALMMRARDGDQGAHCAIYMLGDVFPCVSTVQQQSLLATLETLAANGDRRAADVLGLVFPFASAIQQQTIFDTLILLAEEGDGWAIQALGGMFPSSSDDQQQAILDILIAWTEEGDGWAIEAIGRVFPSVSAVQQQTILDTLILLAEEGNWKAIETLGDVGYVDDGEGVFLNASKAQQQTIFETLVPLAEQGDKNAVLACGSVFPSASATWKQTIFDRLITMASNSASSNQDWVACSPLAFHVFPFASTDQQQVIFETMIPLEEQGITPAWCALEQAGPYAKKASLRDRFGRWAVERNKTRALENWMLAEWRLFRCKSRITVRTVPELSELPTQPVSPSEEELQLLLPFDETS